MQILILLLKMHYLLGTRVKTNPHRVLYGKLRFARYSNYVEVQLLIILLEINCDSALKKQISQYNIYFLVIIPRGMFPTFYWLQKYSDIPESAWQLTYRKRSTKLDRIHLPKYEDFQFLTFEKLEEKLDKICQYEN